MKKMVQRIAGLALVGVVFLPLSVSAQALTYNVGATSDYRYRGITQSRLGPALQGGADYTVGAFYVGAWASTIKWVNDAGGDSSIELDVYGGYKGEIQKDLAYDVGFLQAVYPGSKLAINPNTLEVFGALTYGQYTAKYSHSMTNLFGNADSKNSYYLELGASYDLGDGWGLAPHIGRQQIKGQASALSYTDYSVTGTKDLGQGLSANLGLVGTNANKGLYTTPGGKFAGKSAVTAGIKYVF